MGKESCIIASKPSFLTSDFHKTFPCNAGNLMFWRKTKKRMFRKKWVSENKHKRIVPSLEIYYFIKLFSKTNPETLNFVMKLRGLKKINK